jgi:putative membrane protein
MKYTIRKTPEQAQEETAGVIRRVFKAPSPLTSIIGILIASLVFGFILEGVRIEFLYSSFLIFFLPAILAAIVTIPLAPALGGIMYTRRSFLLAFTALLIMGPSILLWRIVAALNNDLGADVRTSMVLFSFAFALWLRHISLVTTSNSNHLLSLPSSAIQPIVGGLITGLYLGYETRDIYIGVILFIIFGLMAFSFLRMVNTPLRRAFNVDGISMAGQFLDHIAKRERDDVSEIENFFESISSPIDAHIGVISARKGEDIKALMVVPSIHPGPFGYIGGSNLPAKLANDLRKTTSSVLVPHGPSTHDYNPSSQSECKKVSFMVGNLLHDMEYSSESSAMVRRTMGDANACAQMFGNSCLVVASLAPRPTDDLDFSTGYAAMAEGKKHGVDDCLVIDAHNSLERGSGHVHFGSRKARYIIEAAGKAVEQAMKERTKGVRIGLASASGFSVDRDGLGEKGIQVMVVETGGRKFGYLLYDGNNMVAGLREKILNKVEKILDDAEILTTDNHSVNATMGGFNPVGWKMDHERLVATSENLVMKAIEDLEDVEVGMKTGLIHDFNIFGHQSAARFASVINSTIHSLRWNTFTNMLITVALSALVFFYFF